MGVPYGRGKVGRKREDSSENLFGIRHLYLSFEGVEKPEKITN
jgi:hypothetical protein